MYPRRLILKNQDLAHVHYRCHDRNYFLRPTEIKDFLLRLMAKYKIKYSIQVFDFNIMDNHAHFIVRASSVENLGNFMRTVNSQLARYINKYWRRDSQAIRERYKSPVITSARYLEEAIQYVWTNRYRVDRNVRPEDDRYCSAHWRIKQPYKKISNPKTTEEKHENLLALLLDGYEKLGIGSIKNEIGLVRQWLSKAMKRVDLLLRKVFEHSHTIADNFDVKFRGELLGSFKRSHAPPNYCF